MDSGSWIHGSVLGIVDTVGTADIVLTADTLDVVKSVNSVDNLSSVNSVHNAKNGSMHPGSGIHGPWILTKS